MNIEPGSWGRVALMVFAGIGVGSTLLYVAQVLFG